MIPGDLLSAFPHRQFHTLPGLLDSWAALPNSDPNACMPMQGGSLYHFYDGLWYDPAERRTHDLPCLLSQPDTFHPQKPVKRFCHLLIVTYKFWNITKYSYNFFRHKMTHMGWRAVKPINQSTSQTGRNDTGVYLFQHIITYSCNSCYLCTVNRTRMIAAMKRKCGHLYLGLWQRAQSVAWMCH